MAAGSLEIPQIIRDAVAEVVENLGFEDYSLKMRPGSAKGDNYFGEIYKVDVEGLCRTQRRAVTLFVKKAPDIPIFRKVMNVQRVYSREMFVFSTMLPYLCAVQEKFDIPQEERFSAPKFYKGVETEYSEMLIMEDLTSKGYRMYDRLQPLDYDHVSLSIKNLARYHATTFYLKAREPKVYEEFVSNAIKMKELSGDLQLMFDNHIKYIEISCQNEDRLDKLLEYGKGFCKVFGPMLDGDDSAPYTTLCHGDCWSNNFQFKYENDKLMGMIMVDWQIMRESSPMTDIMYMLLSVTDKAMREKYWPHLIDLYYETLTRSSAKMNVDISDLYPENIYREHVRKYIPYGMMMACALLPITLSVRGETPDLGDILEKAMNKTPESIKITDNCKERLADVLEFCYEYL